MTSDPRRTVRLAVLAVLGCAPAALSAEVVVPRIGLAPSFGVGAAPAALSGAVLSFAPAAAPMLAPPAALGGPEVVRAAAAPEVSLAAPGVFPAGSAAAAASSAFDPEDGSRWFDGGRERAASPVAAGPRDAARAPSGFIRNADGVWVGGRVAEQALWINGMYAELSPKIDLADVMNVMDDAYDEARVKLRSVEKAAADRRIAASSVHLEGTRNWLDAVLVDAEGRRIAVHTHRVYFHPAPRNPASEIAEGIRRVDKYLEKAAGDFGPGGLAEREFGGRFSAIELTFDTRGYREIEDHLRAKEAVFRAAYGGLFRFRYVTEPRMASAPLRAEYNRLVEKYMDQPEGLLGILDGVTYSREVGVGHELNSHKKRLAMGLRISQAGRDFFGKKVLPDGTIVEEYKTEFDAVTEPEADARKAPRDRDVVLWEDKSTRVWMPLEKTMEETFLYKLRIYRDNRAIIEESLGGAPLKVAFSVDVGGLNRKAARQGVLVWKDPRQKELMEHLQEAAPGLSREYGFPVSFVFVNSHPNEDPDLFYKQPMSQAEWEASQRQGGARGVRKHGRGRR